MSTPTNDGRNRPGLVEAPDGDLVTLGEDGVRLVREGEQVDDEAGFVQPKGRTAATISLGISQSIDNSEGGVSKTFFPQIMTAFNVGNSELGVLNALASAARMAFGPIWAIAADRFGRKKVLFVVTGLWGLWTIATGFANSWTQLLTLFAIALVGTVAGEPILNGLLGSMYRASERGRAFGLVRSTSAGLGIIITPILGQFGDNPDGWRYAMYAMGGLSVLSGILILIFVHEPEKVTASDIAELREEAGVFRPSDVPKLFKIPTLVGMAFMLPLVTSLVLFGFMNVVWARNLGYGVKNGSYLFTVFSIGSMLSALLGGFLADRFTRKFGNKGRIMLFQLYAVAFASIVALTMYFSRWWDSDTSPLPKGEISTNDPSLLYYVMVFLMGLVFSIGFSGCVLPMVSSVAPRQLSATTFALLFSLIQGALTTVYSLIVGKVADAIGDLQLTLLVGVCVPYLLNALLWFVFYKTYDKDVLLQPERTRMIDAGTF